jgi:outer membrane protein OmpA-like peptidoglycan-associated protein
MKYLPKEHWLLALVFLLLLMQSSAYSQEKIVYLTNGSFEDVPRRGVDSRNSILGWFDCGQSNFPGESPPDIHPTPDTAWEVTKSAIEGNTYLGMVVRENHSWESVSQAVSSTIEGGQCYEFSVYLSQSKIYLSRTSWNDHLESFTKPIVLRIWGGNSFCQKQELLGESPIIENEDWRKFNFRFEPKMDHRYITLEAFYKTPALFLYNGNVLVDKASDIYMVPCEQEKFIVDTERQQPIIEKVEPDVPPKSFPSEKVTGDEEVTILEIPDEEPKKVKILSELERDKLQKGQTIRLKQLYFNADSSKISAESYDVLEELSEFLSTNKDVVIEIGGHTNTIPPHAYCDRLSEERAKAVTDYLKAQGIPESQLEYKGYGKRDPLSINDKYNKEERRRNQRVEIKILSLNG